MSDGAGLVFNRVAEDYDRVRPGYPPELVDAACELAGLGPGSHVVEVGCGTGKLTRVLAERGFRVEAIDPGKELIQIAQRHVREPAVHFHAGRFEDVELPAGAFAAVFSATAFHWVDPDVGWRKAASLLRPGGTLALLAHTVEFEPSLLAAWRQVLPEASSWVAQDIPTLLSDAEARLGNVSELWALLAHRDLARPEAATLFRDVRLRAVQIHTQETAAELIALIRTQSSYLLLDVEHRLELERLTAEAVEEMGGTYRPTLFAVLATARRA